ncbi:MAG: FecR domain-containing protein [Sedimentisphaerales bacterium]|nr:FecR domain-containing protein [Sedimentisphaerales bacterium]
MISCATARGLIVKALDGTIEPAERAELEAHAEMCQACRAELRGLELTQEVIGDAFSSQTETARAKAQIMAQLSDWARPPIHRVVRPRAYWAQTAIAAGVMLVAGLALGIVVERRPQGPTLVEVPMRAGHVGGMVLVRHDGSDSWQPLQSGAVVYQGDTFHSAAKATFVLELENNSTIRVTPNSMLALVSYGDKTEFSLEQGECTASLQSPHGPFFVRTPHGRVEALGTEFTVTVSDD